MPEATSTSTRSRRGMLAGITTALLSVVSFVSGRSAAAGESQDSDLLILCEEFYRTQAELDHWHATGFRLEPLTRETEAYRLWEAEDDRFFWANHDAFEAVRDMSAKTQAGIVAKSKVLVEQMGRDVAQARTALSCDAAEADSGKSRRRASSTDECLRLDPDGHAMDARYRLVSRDSAAPRRTPVDDGFAPGSAPWGQWREPGGAAAYGSAGRSGGWFGGGRGFWNW